jgi:hypothetical protein
MKSVFSNTHRGSGMTLLQLLAVLGCLLPMLVLVTLPLSTHAAPAADRIQSLPG